MLNMNRVTLLGHAGRDPEIRTIKSGEKTATFSLATTDKWRRKDGGTGEATQWHRIVVFGAAVAAVESWSARAPRFWSKGALPATNIRTRRATSRRVTEIVVAGPQGHVNVLSPRRDDGRAEEGGEAEGTGDPGGTIDARTPTGEADGAAPDGPSRIGGQ